MASQDETVVRRHFEDPFLPGRGEVTLDFVVPPPRYAEVVYKRDTETATVKEQERDDLGQNAWDWVAKPVGTGFVSVGGGVVCLAGGVVYGGFSVCRGVVGTVTLGIDWIVRPIGTGLSAACDYVDEKLLGGEDRGCGAVQRPAAIENDHGVPMGRKLEPRVRYVSALPSSSYPTADFGPAPEVTIVKRSPPATMGARVNKATVISGGVDTPGSSASVRPVSSVSSLRVPNTERQATALQPRNVQPSNSPALQPRSVRVLSPRQEATAQSHSYVFPTETTVPTSARIQTQQFPTQLFR